MLYLVLPGNVFLLMSSLESDWMVLTRVKTCMGDLGQQNNIPEASSSVHFPTLSSQVVVKPHG